MSSIYVASSFAINIDDIRMVFDNDPRDKATSIRIDRMVADAIHRHKYIDATKDSTGINALWCLRTILCAVFQTGWKRYWRVPSKRMEVAGSRLQSLLKPQNKLLFFFSTHLEDIIC